MSREFLFGLHPVLECLKAGRRRAYRLFLSRDSKKSSAKLEVEKLSSSLDISTEYCDVKWFNKRWNGEANHQCVALEVSEYSFVAESLAFEKISLQKKSLCLLLDRIQDPRNLGAILRSSLFFAVDFVFISSHDSSTINPTVVKASSGAAEALQVCQVNNLKYTMQKLKDFEFWIYALSPDADQNLAQTSFAEKSALLLGSEGLGVKNILQKNSDLLVNIPRLSDLGSLNVSTAAGIALYEFKRPVQN